MTPMKKDFPVPAAAPGGNPINSNSIMSPSGLKQDARSLHANTIELSSSDKFS